MTGPYLDARIDECLVALLLLRRLLPLALEFNASGRGPSRIAPRPYRDRGREARAAYGLLED